MYYEVMDVILNILCLLLYNVNVKNVFVWIMMSVVLSCLEDTIMNDYRYVNGVHIFILTHICRNE